MFIKWFWAIILVGCPWSHISHIRIYVLTDFIYLTRASWRAHKKHVCSCCCLGTDWEKRHKNIKYLFIHGPVHEIVSWDYRYSRAGDALLLITDQSTQQMSVILQIDIDKLASWIKTWQMQFNVTWINVMRWGYLIGRRNLRWWILTPMAKSCLLIWELCYLMSQDGILMWKILWSKQIP